MKSKYYLAVLAAGYPILGIACLGWWLEQSEVVQTSTAVSVLWVSALLGASAIIPLVLVRGRK